MKKLYMLMIIIFSIFVISDVHADVVRRDIKPLLICAGDSNNNQPCYSGSDIQKVSYGVNDYYYRGFSSSTWVKVSARYDLSSTTEDYVTFIVRMNKSNYTGLGTLTLGGATCESVPNSSLSYEAYGFICENPKKDVYMDYLFAQDVGGTGSLSVYLMSNLGFYNDKYQAGMNTIATVIQDQTQQQQQQHEQIMNSDNSSNQNDFISFATNYFINDTTGTKSFLNVVPNFLNQLNNGTCTPLTLTIPFLSKNNELTIPCMVGFLTEHGFGNLITIYQFVLSFIVAYWLTVNWFKLFKETIDPFNYRIEVMDL